MINSISRNRRRWAVVIHYLAVTAFIVALLIPDITTPVALVLLGTLLTAIITWLYAHVMSGALKFVGTKFEKLDEREVQVLHEAYRRSHKVLRGTFAAVLVIVGLLYKSTPFHNDPIVFQPAFLILFCVVMSLPETIIAWTQRDLSRQ